MLYNIFEHSGLPVSVNSKDQFRQELYKNCYAGQGCYVIELNTDWADGTDAMRVDDFKQKQDKNSLWGNSHASSI